jgi:large subunit ribosomal protein L21
MYAIIKTGGKQLKVSEGDVVSVERLKDAKKTVTFTPIFVSDDGGNVITDPKTLKAAKVKANVLGEERGQKLDIFKYKNKTGYRRRMGHRQTYTSLEVTGISLGAKKPAKAKPEKAAATSEEA